MNKQALNAQSGRRTPPTPVGRRAAAIRDRERRRTRQRLTHIAWRTAMAVGVVALAAGLILAYRAAGPQRATSSPDMITRAAPALALKTADGVDVNLSDFRGKKSVLLFFNEGYGCDPCWQQAAQHRIT